MIQYGKKYRLKGLDGWKSTIIIPMSMSNGMLTYTIPDRMIEYGMTVDLFEKEYELCK